MPPPAIREIKSIIKMKENDVIVAGLSKNGLAKASNGYSPDFDAQELAIGREFKSKSGYDMVEVAGKTQTFTVLAGSIGKLAVDYPDHVVNAEGTPATVGERYRLKGLVGSANGILFGS